MFLLCPIFEIARHAMTLAAGTDIEGDRVRDRKLLTN